MRFFRDSYNRISLTFGTFKSRAEVDFSAEDEPWSGPSVRLMIRAGRRWLVLNVHGGRRS